MTLFLLLPDHKVAFLRDRGINEGKCPVILSLYGRIIYPFTLERISRFLNDTDTRAVPKQPLWKPLFVQIN